MEMETNKLKAILRSHKLWLETSGLQGVKADLRGADLQNIRLDDANLCRADLRGADFENANLQSVNLRGADLRGANLKGANLQNANLHFADFNRANLRDANLQNADLIYNTSGLLKSPRSICPGWLCIATGRTGLEP
jgi:uncharacterized protein YjbI with pentapeptide repeats